MATSKSEFQRWFVDSLANLRKNGDAGFIFVFVAFPLLERYLRRKSGCPDGQNLTPGFFKNLGVMFPDIAGREQQFWDCYRNGLLHHATFPQAKLDRVSGIWIPLPGAGISGYDSRPVYYLAATTQFFLNPISFFDLVTKSILDDFATYEGGATVYYGLPSVVDQTTVTPTLVPTINFNLPRTGSNSP
jgi:hypothetical protein